MWQVDADINMKGALERLEEEYEVTFKKRQEKFDAAIAAIKEKKAAV